MWLLLLGFGKPAIAASGTMPEAVTGNLHP
jgi:hypothetical protein